MGRFCQRVKKCFAAKQRMPWNLQDIFPTTRTTHHDLDIYIWLVRETSERPLLYRHTAVAAHTVIICQLRHPACPRKTISLMLERFPEGANPGEVASVESPPSGLSLDRVFVTTTESDAQLIKTSHLLYGTLIFPDSKPTLLDLLALAESISHRNRTYTVIDGGACIFYGAAVYCALQRIFDGRSEHNPGCQSALPAFFSMLNTYERKIEVAVGTFPKARLHFGKTHADTQLASIRRTSILKADLTAGFRRQLGVDSEVVDLRDQEDAEPDVLQELKKDVHIAFLVGREKERTGH
ncbi:hypothetical protein MVEN_02200000 [Mycena venus]|uniref:Uncharacterized protein n=1 Tax=Mycena venus TaxID=2733690 RepID=A0A8H6X7E5_9AGAR|nr:hypothetical protein MVEN_02200000 [Mycena venus]